MRPPALARLISLTWILQAGIAGAFAGPDAQVSQPDSGTTQAETSVAWRPPDAQFPNGLLCAAWVDAGNSSTESGIDYGYSAQGGAPGAWVPMGALPPVLHEEGQRLYQWDPDVDYSMKDGRFYFVGNMKVSFGERKNLGMSESTDCVTIQGSQVILDPDPSLPNGEKPLMAIDNWPASPHFGRRYVSFQSPSTLLLVTSTNGAGSMATWGPPVSPYPGGYNPMLAIVGPWPTVAPDGNVYVAWLRKQTNGLIDIHVARSTTAGSSFELISPALEGGTPPNDPDATCNIASYKTKLKGKVEVLPTPQIEADHLGNLHIVYTKADPNNPSDRSNVYYRRLASGATQWEPEIRLNTDGGNADQFNPTLLVGRNGRLAVYWYDRREATDPLWPEFRLFYRASIGNGQAGSWKPNTALGDILSPTNRSLVQDCFMGHYNEGDAEGNCMFMIWGDNRISTPGNPDVWFEKVTLSPPVCAVSYCCGTGYRCVNSGTEGSGCHVCCAYSAQEDPSCLDWQPAPPYACES